MSSEVFKAPRGSFFFKLLIGPVILVSPDKFFTTKTYLWVGIGSTLCLYHAEILVPVQFQVDNQGRIQTKTKGGRCAQMPLKQRYFFSLNLSGWNGFLAFHCIIRLGHYQHPNFFIDILQWGHYEHHAHNRLKHDAHITPVEGGGNKPNAVQKMLNNFFIVPSLAKNHYGLHWPTSLSWHLVICGRTNKSNVIVIF